MAEKTGEKVCGSQAVQNQNVYRIILLNRIRDVGLAVAVLTSLRAVRENPVTMAIWGLIVAAVLAIGFLPLFVGLAVPVPILAHSSWHLYRKIVDSATPV